ncbi:hypothetical protein Curi_c06020 [Gottschalkia acidurici 9a]|uniref:DUF3888 domain-containing protein n=1 Tax=Gottschalkia acidurici (strain ATCC 7906 / DSM 604 / BCRC 14475 / CIP 104303 / KCTC 5404 / NCIMB 10678 / 9a) TaxID=1128398 RepID=K0AZ62_GOTA9|nr:DUF3888 domain-containing protein [Gottschalkia acidurici]AFS77676.1 hypothetical protein Curi_c06020 [Gottschalkia acidurici 9a]
MINKSSKVLLITLCIVIVFSSFSFSSSSLSDESKENLYKDFLLTFLSSYIADSITEYYGYSKSFDLWDAKVLSLERLEQGLYYFKIIVQVKTFQGAHNPPYGIETVTIQQDVHGIKVIDFIHEDFKDDKS